jgi:hypothetical protein
VLNEGLERTLIVSAANQNYPSTVLQVNVPSLATTESKGVQVNQSGLGSGVEIIAGNTANASDGISVTHGGTGTGIHSINNNRNGSGGVFEKNLSAISGYVNEPRAELEVRHPPYFTDGLSGLRIYNKGGNHSSWTLYTGNNSAALELIAKGLYRGSFNAGTGAYTTASDQRLKSEITDMSDLIKNVMKLKPKRYYYTSDANRKWQLGFLAQEVEPLFPELVYKTISDKGEERYTMDYAAFGVVAIKALQEQQKEIDELKKELSEIKAMLKGR